MATHLEIERPTGDHPTLAITRIMMDFEKLPPDDTEGRKRRLGVLDEVQVTHRGDFRYDLMLGKTEEGEEFLSLELISSEIVGLARQPWDEKERSYVFAGNNRTPVRTGYLEIDEERIRERDAVGISQFSTPPLEDLLALHYPDHQIAVRDVDR